MSEPDRTYARNAIGDASKKYNIAILLDYELTSFDVNESYIDRQVGTIAKNVYRNQPYIVYTYFRDTQTMVISTNINNESHNVVNQKKEGIDTDARVVKEILYFQQNLERSMGISNWNFNLNTESSRNVALATVKSIVMLILGYGVFPNDNWKWKGFKRKEKSNGSRHSD